MPINKLEFDTRISKDNGGGFRIWIPKRILTSIPNDLWIIATTTIRADGFKQILSNHPISKAGVGKRYIPIYCEDKQMDDYTGLGRVKVEIVFTE